MEVIAPGEAGLLTSRIFLVGSRLAKVFAPPLGCFGNLFRPVNVTECSCRHENCSPRFAA